MNHLPDLYETVLERSAGRCQCTGQCGFKHRTEGGECRHGRHDGSRLTVVPVADPAAPPRAACLVPAEQMTALCRECLGPIRAKASKARQQHLAERAADTEPTLF
ncbi:hypothetical protein KV557_24730 [Kitasatospora aureofaciens]|uniref:hypothetical protein n=1 Tax=Kitasatospora aureofaciens TaxID=1894 RepID=UPI001C47191A|nr:hypothetical protein [Kitasatospora aureofaciens]MBV6700271.1 hypothetical protein [Kitasatospora aureofaciens]